MSRSSSAPPASRRVPPRSPPCRSPSGRRLIDELTSSIAREQLEEGLNVSGGSSRGAAGGALPRRSKRAVASARTFPCRLRLLRPTSTSLFRRAGAAASRLIAALAILLLFGDFGARAYPALTGRVVDDAHILNPMTQADLERKLANLEAKSSIQLVVATVKSLDGHEIEPYANALFRQWKLGDSKTNNGLLLLVAPNEHRVRIEVGPGLEGVMTDAVSSIIIRNAITPRFKAKDFDGGVTRGVDDIITALTSDTSDWKTKIPTSEPKSDMPSWAPVTIWLILIAIIIFSRRNSTVGTLAYVAASSGAFSRRGRRLFRRRRLLRRRRNVLRRRRLGELVSFG